MITEGENITDEMSVSYGLAESNTSQVYMVSIIDLSGNKVFVTKTATKIFTLPISGIKDGTYIVTATDNKSIWQSMLIVKH